MNNIFEGAKFGDKFLTRDGRAVKYCFKLPEGWWFVLPNGEPFLVQGVDGRCHIDDIFQLDIVSRYQEEPVDEEKLDELADEHWDLVKDDFDGVSHEEHNKLFKAGYLKAIGQ